LHLRLSNVAEIPHGILGPALIHAGGRDESPGRSGFNGNQFFLGSDEYRSKAYRYEVFEKIAVSAEQRAERLIAGYAKAVPGGGSQSVG